MDLKTYVLIVLGLYFLYYTFIISVDLVRANNGGNKNTEEEVYQVPIEVGQQTTTEVSGIEVESEVVEHIQKKND